MNGIVLGAYYICESCILSGIVNSSTYLHESPRKAKADWRVILTAITEGNHNRKYKLYCMEYNFHKLFYRLCDMESQKYRLYYWQY